jgi:hypothetical protein
MKKLLLLAALLMSSSAAHADCQLFMQRLYQRTDINPIVRFRMMQKVGCIPGSPRREYLAVPHQPSYEAPSAPPPMFIPPTPSQSRYCTLEYQRPGVSTSSSICTYACSDNQVISLVSPVCDLMVYQ